MKNNFVQGLLLGLIAATAVGVLFLISQTKPLPSKTSPTNTLELLMNKKWYVSVLDDNSVKNVMYFELTDKTTVSGFSGCNTFNGSYKLDNWTLSFLGLASTKVGCEESVMSEENKFLTAFGKVASFDLLDEDLILKTDSEEIIFNNNVNTASKIVGRWGYLKSVEGGVEKSKVSNSSITLQFTTDSKITGEACNLITGSYTVGDRGDTLSITAATTKKLCSPEEINDQENGFLNHLSNAKALEVISPQTLKIFYNDSDYIEFARAFEGSVRTLGAPLASLNAVVNALTQKEEYDEGEDVTFEVKVEPSLINPRVANGSAVTGSITLFDEETPISDPMPLLNPKDLSNSGTVEITVNELQPGAHIITARYSGDENYVEAGSEPVGLTIKAADLLKNTTTTITSSSLVITQGQPLSLSANVTSEGTPSPSGIVDFFDGSKLLGSSNLDVNGNTSYSTSVLLAGAHSLLAKYRGDDVSNSSFSSPLSILVNQPPQDTVLNLTTDKANVSLGETVLLSLQATGGTAIPTGNIEFYDNSKLVSTVPLNAQGVATLTLTMQVLGEHTLNGAYAGDSSHISKNSNLIKVTVGPALVKTQVNLVSSVQSANRGTSIDFSANVVSDSGALAAGTVTFLNNNAQMGTINLDARGAAKLSTSSLTPGIHNITVSYSGNAVFSSSNSNSLPVVISGSLLDATVTLNVDKSTVSLQDQLTFTVKVVGQSNNSVPTGTVAIEDGGIKLANVNLDSNGNGTFTTKELSVGSHTISANYSGDTIYSPDSSTAVQVKVEEKSEGIPLNIALIIVVILLILVISLTVFLLRKPVTPTVTPISEAMKPATV